MGYGIILTECSIFVCRDVVNTSNLYVFHHYLFFYSSLSLPDWLWPYPLSVSWTSSMFPYPHYSRVQFIPHAILSHRLISSSTLIHLILLKKKAPEMNPHPRLHPHPRRDSSDTYHTHSGFPPGPYAHRAMRNRESGQLYSTGLYI